MKIFVTKAVILFLLVLGAGALHAAHPAQALLASANEQPAENSASQLHGKSVENQIQKVQEEPGFLSGFSIASTQVALEQFLQVLYWRLDILLTANLAKVSYDLATVFDRISQGRGVAGFLKMFQMLLVVFLLALGVEYLFRKLILKRFKADPQASEGSGLLRLWTIVSQAIPEFMALGLFVGAAYTFYVLIYAEYFSGICPLYLSMETTIVIARSITIVSKILFSPGNEKLRLLPFDDTISRIGHRSVLLFAWLVTGGLMFASLVEHAGLVGDSKLVVRICFGSILIIAVVLLLIFNRKHIRQWIRGDELTVHLFRVQLADKWLPITFCYIVSLWVLWIVRLLIVGPEFGFAFAVSFLIVPIYLILDSLLGWLQCSLGSPSKREESPDSLEEERGKAPLGIAFYLRAFARIVVLILLSLWMLNLWGEGISFSDAEKMKALEVLFILCVSFMSWKLINKIITDYLDNRARIQAETEEDVDSEWGDAPMLDRGQTLLPLLRKFIGIFMLVMVLLFILSTLGVNIAPLLAGAGVVGIAIGFGAQKLVSDVLSGFFYLLDDAFRVGEYIKTSSISGAVEKITLRNVMLRHHRGMLQIVPYSDLGAITNFMRGGIVVKFNLQFPYDTDVDQVRKVIKRVGITMLEDPEFGKNFIKQVKSQGIREVADSVLTIRVKFTAHPGTHFLIRREAYRRITEALAAKGIFYAHRKVIVEVPEGADSAMTDESRKKIAEAGAAAQLATAKKEEAGQNA